MQKWRRLKQELAWEPWKGLPPQEQGWEPWTAPSEVFLVVRLE